MVETETPPALPVSEDWTEAPWRKLERHVYRLQTRIYRAQQRGDAAVVHSLQRLLMKSRASRLLAVRRVTQDNHGKKTAGVDGIKAVGPSVRLLFVERLRALRTIRAQPVRRVWIPKPGKDEKRPLGIPVLLDRAHQALAKLALGPQWEARFAPHSYGFRPGRSCHDAIGAIFNEIRYKDKYVLDADIKGCFDGIDHQALLNKLASSPAIRRSCKAWLQAGVLEVGGFVPTTSGTPQGGVISPLLANIALDGMEAIAAQAYRHGRIHPTLIRYADDFVILCQELDGILAARAAVEQYLAGMGLRLHPDKTRVTHTLLPYEGALGFTFLGFAIRQRPVGRTHSGRCAGKLLGFKTHITPSREAVTRHMRDIRARIGRKRSATQAALIDDLNPVIRGWTNYHRTVVARATFRACDQQLFQLLRSWARFRHPHQGRRWVARRYWSFHPGDRWAFVAREAGEVTQRLRRHSQTTIRRHIKVRGATSPYDGNLRYWSTRLRDHPLTRGLVARLLLQQRGRCPHCGLLFKDEDLLEVDHRLPLTQGGSDTLANKQILHRHCHDQKTAGDYAGGYT
jgi:RNA-directed DNA polymerase